MEIIHITTLNLKTNLNIITLYIPPNINNNSISSKFELLLQQFNNEDNTIIAGDINAHNPLWERNGKNDRRGQLIANSIINSNFIILNNGDHTYISDSTGHTSAPDITLAHTNIAYKMDWEKNFETLNSDHFISKMQIEDENR